MFSSLWRHQSCSTASKSILRSHASPIPAYFQQNLSLPQHRHYTSLFQPNPTIYLPNRTDGFSSLPYSIHPIIVHTNLKANINRDFDHVNLQMDTSAWSVDILHALNHVNIAMDHQDCVTQPLTEENLRILGQKEHTSISQQHEDSDSDDLFTDDEAETQLEQRRAYLHKKYPQFIHMKWFNLTDTQMENFEALLDGFASMYGGASQYVPSQKISDTWVRVFRYFFDMQESERAFPLRLLNGGHYSLQMNKGVSVIGSFKHRLVSNDDKELNYVSFSGPNTDSLAKTPQITAAFLGAAVQNFEKLPTSVPTQELYHVHFYRGSATIYHCVVHRDYLRSMEEKIIPASRFDELSATEENVRRHYLLTRSFGTLHMNNIEDREVFMDVLDRIYFGAPNMKTGEYTTKL